MRARQLWLAALFATFLTPMLGAAEPAEPVEPEEVWTAEDCAGCHDETVAAFAAGAHGHAMGARSAEFFQLSCVACHGPATVHLEEMTPETIERYPSPDACLSCHPGMASKTELLIESHNRQGITCLECHESGHAGTGVDAMLKDEPRELCATCHLQQKAEFRLPFAHRDGTKPFNCTNCHSNHGDNRVGRLTLTPESSACVDCHTGQARPFVFPHPTTSHEGCSACHFPHGSTNPRMLTRRTVSLLCLECHTNTPAFHDLTSPRYRTCLNCHAAVHGSNRDPRLIEE